MSKEPQPTGSPRERMLVCGVILPDFPVEFEGELSEARALAVAAGGVVVGEGIVQRRAKGHPATLMGRGKVEEIGEQVAALSPDVVLVDNDLTPAQGRNLEKAWDVRVVDRSELILDIFARRAQTAQAIMQVELAQNEYLLPRLRRMWTHLERMEGAIGTRGPGETQLESDRRLLNRRISDLRGKLRQIERRKQRQVRTRADEYKVGLVGYTNAGKSSLLNRLTGSDEFTADMPFATLDTRTRKWELPDRRVVLLSDTVGFLQRLPHHLVASFHATLEETIHADLLLHVVDASHADAAHQMRAVEEVLHGISPHLTPEILVFNKIDRVEDPIRLHLLLEGREHIDVAHVSARTGEGLDRLTQLVTGRLDARASLVDVRVPFADGRSLARVRSLGAAVSESVDSDSKCVLLRMRLSPAALGTIKQELGDGVAIDVVQGPRQQALSEE